MVRDFDNILPMLRNQCKGTKQLDMKKENERAKEEVKTDKDLESLIEQNIKN